MKLKEIAIFHNENDTWQKFTYFAVFQESIGASVNKGYESSNQASAWLFYKDNYEIDLDKISIGDILCITDISSIKTQSDLQKAGVRTYNITTISNNEMGTYKTKHVQIGAR